MHAYFLTVLTAVFVLFSNQAQACECWEEPIERKFNETPFIFTGEIIGSNDVVDEPESEYPMTITFYMIKVDHAYKGSFGPYAIVSAETQGTSCATYKFPVGTQMLYWVRSDSEHSGSFDYGYCSNTSSTANASDTIEWLENRTGSGGKQEQKQEQEQR